MKSVAFHPEAEFIAAARYYEDQVHNLGLDFVSAAEATYQRLPPSRKAVVLLGPGSGAPWCPDSRTVSYIVQS